MSTPSGVVETAMLAFGAYTVKRNRLKIYANLVIISPLLIYINEKKKRKDGTLPFLHNNISHLHLFSNIKETANYRLLICEPFALVKITGL